MKRNDPLLTSNRRSLDIAGLVGLILTIGTIILILFRIQHY